MSQYNVSQLRDLTHRAAVKDALITYQDHGAWRKDTLARIDALNTFMQARASNFAGSSAPAVFSGQIWANTSNTGRVVWQGSRLRDQFDDEFASRLEAWRKSYSAGSGTAKFLPTGRFDYQSSGLLTIPANLFSAAGQFANVFGANESFSIGNTTLTLNNFVVCSSGTTSSTVQWVQRGFLVRIDDTHGLYFGFQKAADDSLGKTGLVSFAGQQGTDFASDIAVVGVGKSGAMGTFFY